jgi:hypothetical protein
MKTKLIQLAVLVGGLMLLCVGSATAQQNDAVLGLSMGAEFTSGTYGGDTDIEDTYIPITASVDTGRIAFRLVVPYLSVRAPMGTIFDPDGIPIPGSGEITTESGLGDIIGSVTVYDVVSNRRSGFAMDLTGKIKLGTADEEKGLGTGETDYSVQADFYKFAHKLTLLGSVGYKFRGDPAGVDLDDVFMGSLGGTYRFTPDVNGGVIFDYRESAISGTGSIQELTGFVSRRINEDWRFQVYVLAGLTDSSPDWGSGIQIKRYMRR